MGLGYVTSVKGSLNLSHMCSLSVIPLIKFGCLAALGWVSVPLCLGTCVLGHLQLFESRGWNEHLRRAWRTIWLAVVHAIWTHRNDAAFHGTLITVDAVVDLIKFKSWLWLKHLLKDFVASFFEWENNPSGCIISSGGIGNR